MFFSIRQTPLAMEQPACQTQTPGQTHQCSRTHVWETQFLDVPLEVIGSKVIGSVGFFILQTSVNVIIHYMPYVLNILYDETVPK